MRAVLVCAAALMASSVAWAEPLEIDGVVANYDTTRDAIDIEIWLDRNPNLFSETISFLASDAKAHASVPGGRTFGLANLSGDEFTMRVRGPDGTTDTPDIPYTMTNAIVDDDPRWILGFQLDAQTTGYHNLSPHQAGVFI